MAKGILRFFGGALILVGLGIIVGVAVITEGRSGSITAAWVSLLWGGCFLVAGAPLLGFAQALDLLEEIARNTRRPDRA